MEKYYINIYSREHFVWKIRHEKFFCYNTQGGYVSYIFLKTYLTFCCAGMLYNPSPHSFWLTHSPPPPLTLFLFLSLTLSDKCRQNSCRQILTGADIVCVYGFLPPFLGPLCHVLKWTRREQREIDLKNVQCYIISSPDFQGKIHIQHFSIFYTVVHC